MPILRPDGLLQRPITADISHEQNADGSTCWYVASLLLWFVLVAAYYELVAKRQRPEWKFDSKTTFADSLPPPALAVLTNTDDPTFAHFRVKQRIETSHAMLVAELSESLSFQNPTTDSAMDFTALRKSLIHHIHTRQLRPSSLTVRG
jgi:hypothetical protein